MRGIGCYDPSGAIMRLVTLAGALLLPASFVSPQSANPGGKDPAQTVIRVNVNLRQVDLIVTNAEGNHVTDLQASDFQLLEDGKPQRITICEWVEVAPPASGARLAALNEKPSFLERLIGTPRFRKTPGNDSLSAPVANPRKEEIRRMIAIVADAKPAPSNSVVIMDRVRKFIDEQVGPGDMVSIRSTRRSITPMRGGRTVQIRDSMGIFQQFTNDKRQLAAATERLPRVCMILRACIPDTAGALMAAIRDLQDLPGRKAVMFVGRYVGPVDNIVSMANRAGVVIYVLDPEGFQERSYDRARALAEKTGGKRILSTEGFDLTKAFNEVIEDLSGYYVLGYHAAGDESDSPSKPAVRPVVDVRVLRPGLIVRARDGRMGAPAPVAKPEPGSTGQPLGRHERLASALSSVFTLDGIRVRLDATFSASTPNRKEKRSPIVHVALNIDGHDVAFADADGGNLKAVLDVVLAVFNADGSVAGAADKRYTLLISKDRAEQFIRAGARSQLDFAVPRPGPYQVRAAVHDAGSGEVGSGYAFLDIPDFNQSRVSLSSPVLRLPDGASPKTAARPHWNEFAPGDTIQYSCEVFGLKMPGKPPAPPDVEAEVKLYRGGGVVAQIPLSPVKVEKTGEQWLLSGSVRIPDGLAPGNYAMELLAYDRLQQSKRRQAAQQWVDVAVVGPEN